jgi:hypothetical protein
MVPYIVKITLHRGGDDGSDNWMRAVKYLFNNAMFKEHNYNKHTQK